MTFRKNVDSFQFQNDRIISYNISFIIAYNITFIKHINLRMCHTRYVPSLQFLEKSILINILYKTISKLIVNIIKCTDDGIGLISL